MAMDNLLQLTVAIVNCNCTIMKESCMSSVNYYDRYNIKSYEQLYYILLHTVTYIKSVNLYLVLFIYKEHKTRKTNFLLLMNKNLYSRALEESFTIIHFSIKQKSSQNTSFKFGQKYGCSMNVSNFNICKVYEILRVHHSTINNWVFMKYLELTF